MKTLYLLITLLVATSIHAQNPLVIKTVGSTEMEPQETSAPQPKSRTWNGKYFYASKNAPAGSINLTVTDGTTAGTQKLASFAKATGSQVVGIGIFAAAQDFMYFTVVSTWPYAGSNTQQQYDLWKTDGTIAGTVLIKSFTTTNTNAIVFNSAGYAEGYTNLSVIGNNMIFRGYDAANGIEIWKTDGTTAGTTILKDINPGTGGTAPWHFAKAGGKAVFSSNAGLYATDFTEAGTVLIKPFAGMAANEWIYEGGNVFKNKYYFYASTAANGMEPWVTDGTAAGTMMLKDCNPGAPSGWPYASSSRASLFFIATEDYAFFPTIKFDAAGASTGSGFRLWRTDGTEAGTIPLSDADSSSVPPMTTAGRHNVMMLLADPAGNTTGKSYVLTSNGTVQGTARLAKFQPTAGNAIMYKDAGWFSSATGVSIPTYSYDIEWHRTDGTATNTGKAFDIYPGQVSAGPITLINSGQPYHPFELNGYLYFFGKNSAGTHLFRYNGDFTYNGTQLGGRWKDSANWNSLMPPGIIDTVFINTGTINALNVDGQKAYAGLLQMQAGTTINFANATDSLFVNNNLSTSSNNNFTGNGVLVLRNASNGTVQLANGFTANNVSVQSSTNLQNGTLTINGQLNLSNDAKLSLNSNNLELAGNGSTATGNATSYIVTNGTGKLTVQNIGAGARTTAVNFPIGTANHYNPVSFTNTGTADHFSIRVQPNVNGAYTGESTSGSPYFTGAVDATWFITEATAGGSVANINLQWNASQELLGFDRTQGRFGHYTGGAWQLSPAVSAVGSNPYTITGTGITSFSPFGIFNSNAVLPVYAIKLSVSRANNSNHCIWNILAADADKMELQRSTDAVNFSPLYSPLFNATGSYTDGNFAGIGKTYYRLKVTSKNGQTAYSNIVWVDGKQLNNIQVYPTIFKSSFTVQNNENTSVQLLLFTLDGKMVQQQPLVKGTNLISTNGLPNGNYFYQVMNGQQKLSGGKLMKQ